MASAGGDLRHALQSMQFLAAGQARAASNAARPAKGAAKRKAEAAVGSSGGGAVASGCTVSSGGAAGGGGERDRFPDMFHALGSILHRPNKRLKMAAEAPRAEDGAAADGARHGAATEEPRCDAEGQGRPWTAVEGDGRGDAAKEQRDTQGATPPQAAQATEADGYGYGFDGRYYAGGAGAASKAGAALATKRDAPPPTEADASFAPEDVSRHPPATLPKPLTCMRTRSGRRARAPRRTSRRVPPPSIDEPPPSSPPYRARAVPSARMQARPSMVPCSHSQLPTLPSPLIHRCSTPRLLRRRAPPASSIRTTPTSSPMWVPPSRTRSPPFHGASTALPRRFHSPPTALTQPPSSTDAFCSRPFRP